MSVKPDPERAPREWGAYWRDADHHDWWTRPAEDVLSLIDDLPLGGDGRALDLGCGLGRHAIALARAGYRVTAIDASSAALAHLRRWAQRERLTIEALQGDMDSACLAASAYGLVLAYNVIYHGYRDDMVERVGRIRDALVDDGFLYFTCPSRRDAKYGHGEELAPHTFLGGKSVIPGDLHYFASAGDIEAMLDGFRLVRRTLSEGWWVNRGSRQFYSNWQVLAQKGDGM